MEKVLLSVFLILITSIWMRLSSPSIKKKMEPFQEQIKRNLCATSMSPPQNYLVLDIGGAKESTCHIYYTALKIFWDF